MPSPFTTGNPVNVWIRMSLNWVSYGNTGVPECRSMENFSTDSRVFLSEA